MEEAVRATLQAELLDRRQKLGSAMEESGEAAQLAHLLTEVDAALERLDSGSYGICRVCHDSIEERLLLADPLVQACLDHLTQPERRALERDLELAHAIQLKLLPRRSLGFGGWEVCYHFAPAGAVSGDYCDVVTPESAEGAMLVALGDVSGKGVAASMLMAHLNALVRTLAERREPLPKLVGQVNRAFCESTLPAHYATLVCGMAGPDGGLDLCNAGHVRPILLRGSNASPLPPGGLPVGLFCSAEFAVQSLSLGPGDSLVLYTDGLTEARDPAGDEYGADRLASLLGSLHALEPQALLSACLADHVAFRAGTPVSDDLTLLVLRRSA